MGERAPSQQEFHQVLTQEFDFLIKDYGFQSCIPAWTEFGMDFRKTDCCISICGRGYGDESEFSLTIRGEEIPWRFIAPAMSVRLCPQTDSHQLDDLREIAVRLHGTLSPLLRGEYSLADQALQFEHQQRIEREARRDTNPRSIFFSRADKLWKAGDWTMLVNHLSCSPHALSPAWGLRLEQAKENKSKCRIKGFKPIP